MGYVESEDPFGVTENVVYKFGIPSGGCYSYSMNELMLCSES